MLGLVFSTIKTDRSLEQKSTSIRNLLAKSMSTFYYKMVMQQHQNLFNKFIAKLNSNFTWFLDQPGKLDLDDLTLLLAKRSKQSLEKNTDNLLVEILRN